MVHAAPRGDRGCPQSAPRRGSSGRSRRRLFAPRRRGACTSAPLPRYGAVAATPAGGARDRARQALPRHAGAAGVLARRCRRRRLADVAATRSRPRAARCALPHCIAARCRPCVLRRSATRRLHEALASPFQGAALRSLRGVGLRSFLAARAPLTPCLPRRRAAASAAAAAASAQPASAQPAVPTAPFRRLVYRRGLRLGRLRYSSAHCGPRRRCGIGGMVGAAATPTSAAGCFCAGPRLGRGLPRGDDAGPRPMGSWPAGGARCAGGCAAGGGAGRALCCRRGTCAAAAAPRAAMTRPPRRRTFLRGAPCAALCECARRDTDEEAQESSERVNWYHGAPQRGTPPRRGAAASARVPVSRVHVCAYSHTAAHPAAPQARRQPRQAAAPALAAAAGSCSPPGKRCGCESMTWMTRV